MKIAGYSFRTLTGPILCSSPGIFIYTHQASGKCFVRALRNSRTQRGKNNYPTHLKELLKIHPSEVLIFHADLAKDTKEALFLASRAVITHLSEKGVLFKRTTPGRGGVYRVLHGEAEQRYTVWSMTHKTTGAVFYFEEIRTIEVLGKISQRLLTFNNYVIKQIQNANRVMYAFIKQNGLSDISHWIIRDLDLDLPNEKTALQHITKLSKQHLESGDVVLNRIASNDALYYRNSFLRLPHKSIEEYVHFEREDD